MGLDVSPALFNFAEDGSVAADNGNAGHQEAEQHEELLWRFVVFPDEERKKTTEDQGSIAAPYLCFFYPRLLVGREKKLRSC